MAKKPLTPEQAEIKAIKKARRSEKTIKFFAFLLAVVITLATVFIAKGQAEKAGAGAGGEAQQAETTTKPVEAEGEKVDDVAAALEIVNKVTGEASKGNYKWVRTSEYVDPIDVGSATGILNGIIQGIDKNSDLNSVVGGFLGIGNKEGEVVAGAGEGFKADYLLKEMALTEADVTSLAKDGDTYNIVVKDCANVKKDGSNSLNRVTNDFITHEEVVDGISGFTTAITVSGSDVQFSAIQVSATIVDGKLTNLVIKYHFKATLNLKAGLTITGKGSADYSMTYSDFAY